ncbi:MAG: transglycosylase SLT domain-containing protein, partial [Pseudomonadota bacterium]
MNIVRVPKKGEARLPLPGPDVRVLTGKDPDAGRSGAGPIRGGIRRAGPQDWFWQRHDPHRRAASPARWQAALAALTDRHRSAKPIVSQKLIASIVDRYGRLIDDAAERHGISPALVAAVIAVESAGREKAVSHAGAGGLMQLMPATARRFGVTDRYAAQQNVQGGSAYLDWLLDNFGQDPILALA